MSDSKAFVKNLVTALTNDQVVKKLQQCLVEPLKFDINNLQDNFKALKNELTKVTETNKQLQNEMSILREQLKKKDNLIDELSHKITSLELEVDNQEQYSRSNSIRISGFPEKQNEDIKDRFVTMATLQMNVDLTENDIEKIHRVGQIKTGRPRNVIVKMKSYEMKTKLLKAKKNLRRSSEDMKNERIANEMDPEIQNDDEDDNEDETEDYSTVYMNEDLTKFRAHLLWMARQLKTKYCISDCWSYNGKIMIKDKSNHIKQIKKESDLELFQ